MTASADATARIIRWLARLDTALAAGDADAAADLFAPESYWRDMVALTWNIHTSEGRAAIGAMLRATLPGSRPHGWSIDGVAHASGDVTEAWVSFRTRAGRGKGYLRLRGDMGWTLLTTLQSLDGHEERNDANGTRAMGVQHGVVRGRETWLERRQRDASELGVSRQPYCVIVGGGQGGIALAARLRQLDVPTLVIEKNARAGDSWRKRYRSLCLHDPVWYDHLPYLPFPEHWPIFSPKDKIGDWLEMYTKVMELDYWSGTECLGAAYDDASATWTVRVRRDGVEHVLRPAQFVIATGMSGFPNVPKVPGIDAFRGTVRHSSGHDGGAGWSGKKCVIVGSNNSAHDICAALWEHGADVTMLQRSPTVVVKSESLRRFVWGRLYSPEAVAAGITTERADLLTASMPLRISPAAQLPIYEQIRAHDATFYAALEAAGFMLTFGEDGAGIHTAYLRRGGGYYIDVGASQLIIDGSIKLRSRVAIERVLPDAVQLSDGSTLPADLIVFATGYGPMNEWAAHLISPEVADQVGKCWGVGSDTKYDPGPWEGELRNMWKPTRQPGLWFHGGNLMQARHYSIYLALQIKARMEGLATPVYGMPEVHHRR